jgi:hypothetical protein
LAAVKQNAGNAFAKQEASEVLGKLVGEMPSSPKGPTIATGKRLFALSGNRCAFPDCPTRLVDRATRSIVGEVCHIKGVKPGSPRHDKAIDGCALHGFDNLILLCNVHHKVIDDNESEFPVERLLRMKEQHERRQEGQAIDDAASEEFVSRVIGSLGDGSVLLQDSPVVGGQVAHTIHNYHTSLSWVTAALVVCAISMLAWYQMRSMAKVQVTFGQIEFSTMQCDWEPLSRPIEIVAPFLNPVGRPWSFGGAPIGLPPRNRWPMGSHQRFPNIGAGSSTELGDDPVLDVTLLNKGTATAVVSRIGIRPIAAWTSPKGPPRSGRISLSDGYALEMETFEIGNDQFLVLSEPVSLIPNDPYRFRLRLDRYCKVAPRNETVIQLLVEANQEIIASDHIYLGMYSVGGERQKEEER